MKMLWPFIKNMFCAFCSRITGRDAIESICGSAYEQVSHHVENKESCNLQPGIFRNSAGSQKLLLAIKGHLVVYSMDNVNDSVIHLTTCSIRTFQATGMRLVRPFTTQEINQLLKRAISLRSYAWNNKQARNLYWGPDRIPGLPKLPWRTCPRIHQLIATPMESPMQSTSTPAISSVTAK